MQYQVEAKYLMYETDEVTKKGKRIRKRVILRALYLSDPQPVWGSGQYRVTLRRRKGIDWYTVSVLPLKKQPVMQNPSGKLESWSVVGKEYVRTDDKSMMESQFADWLRRKIGAKFEQVLRELKTAMPVSNAA